METYSVSFEGFNSSVRVGDVQAHGRRGQMKRQD